MSVRKCLAIASLVLLGSVAAPSKASADWLLTPFVGWNFGGSADFQTDGDGDFDDEFEQRANFGVSLAWMGGGIIGFEADLGYTPNFFENTTGPDDFEFGDNSVTTLMANLMIGIPIGGQTGGGFRPYVVGGIGLVKATADDPLPASSTSTRIRLASMSAAARCSSSPTASASAPTSATSDRSTTWSAPAPSLSISAASSSGAVLSARRSGSSSRLF